MDCLGISKEFWRSRRVFITGHTGFKGGWLTMMLHHLGAEIVGYSLEPPTKPSFFQMARLSELLVSDYRADISDLEGLTRALQQSEADIVFHLAAQSLVREGYVNPVQTYASNVIGTVNILEAVRMCPAVSAAIIVTTDKCYENFEWVHPYRETDRMGGSDPYSSSKACAEILTAGYRRSFLGMNSGLASVASVRAGNVIGGGDWSKDRLIVDCIRSFQAGEPVLLRNPQAVRPWQHVLEPLTGYMMLVEKLLSNDPIKFEGGWNFGPDFNSELSVLDVAQKVAEEWGGAAVEVERENDDFHESQILRLDSSKARSELHWRPRWTYDEAIKRTVEWYKVADSGGDMRSFTERQIETYSSEGV